MPSSAARNHGLQSMSQRFWGRCRRCEHDTICSSSMSSSCQGTWNLPKNTSEKLIQ